MSANGVFAMSVITAITAQNTEEVTDVFELPTSIIAAQIDAVFDDFDDRRGQNRHVVVDRHRRDRRKMLKPQDVVESRGGSRHDLEERPCAC